MSSSITAQTVTPTSLSITVASGATFTITKAEVIARFNAETGSLSARITKALAKLRTDMATALGPDFDPTAMQFDIQTTGDWKGVGHFANLADVPPDVVT